MSVFIHFTVFFFTFTVDKKERKAGHDPEKELADSGFHDLPRTQVLSVLREAKIYFRKFRYGNGKYETQNRKKKGFFYQIKGKKKKRKKTVLKGNIKREKKESVRSMYPKYNCWY